MGRVPHVGNHCVKGLDTFQFCVKSHTNEGTLISSSKQSLELRTELELESSGHENQKIKRSVMGVVILNLELEK